MLPATIGILSLSAVLFYLGLLSARRAAQTRDKDASVSSIQSTEIRRDKKRDDNNRENPDAMAMAGPTGANSKK